MSALRTTGALFAFLVLSAARPSAADSDLSVRMCGTAYPDASASLIQGNYTATVTNIGPQPATGVTVRFSPSGSVAPSQGQCAGSPPFQGDCNLGTLAPGAHATVTLSTFVSDGQTQSVSVIGDQPDPVPSNNSTGITVSTVDCDDLSQSCPLLVFLGKAICERRERDACNGGSSGPTTPTGARGSLAARLAARVGFAATSSLSAQTFFDLRDKVFGSTPSGRRYTQLYYGYGPEVTRLILASSALADQGLSTATLWQGNVQALVDGRGNAATISSAQVDALSSFIESLKSAGSPELRAVLSREQAALNLPSLAGKTMPQAWAHQQQTTPATVTLPAAASIHGLNGSFFHSDLSLLNASATSAAPVSLRYRCFTGTCPNNLQTLTLAPAEMKSLGDVVGTLFNAPESAGPIEIVGDVIADSRVYTPEKPSPTTGALVPGLTVDEAVAEAVLLSLSHSVDRGKGFRTNAGIYNPGAESLRVTFAVYEPSGNRIGETSRDVGPGVALQVNDLFGSSGITRDVQDAYTLVTGDGIREFFAYATVIDNQSQDQVFVRGRNARGVPTGTATLPTAASIHGLNGAFFHSDVRVFNPSLIAPANVTARYRCFTGSCPGTSQTFTVAPREMKAFDDVVATLFSAPESAGPIELAGAVLVDSRVYTPGKPAATTGDDVPALRDDQASSTLVLTSLSRSSNPGAGFRTNVGVYNPGIFSLTVSFSLYGPSGQSLGTATRSLDAGSALQINDIFGAAGVVGDVPNAYCIVSGSGFGTPFGLGKFFTYATVVDNQSQDTTFVVGRALPTGAIGAAVAGFDGPSSRSLIALVPLIALVTTRSLRRKNLSNGV